MLSSFFKMSALTTFIALFTVGCSTTTASHSNKNKAPQKIVDIHAVTAQGIQQKIGTVTFQDSSQGLMITSHLSALPSGYHGFHIHENGSCAPAEKDGKMGAALAAGGHFNPTHAIHGTPNDGHFGDLPVLNVDSDGHANTTVIAPRLKLENIQGLSIMIHAGGDNYSDHPKPLGGGGARIACGVIQ
ncbi:superoxide dismutase family protein [Acinetobacter sp. ANC 4648]|uniref:superoxide dismutase family protein n=1 Tax=Acinetobacter sp. ANC 4648 TaxID=1977875 RepID=UPI000A34636B|nr:superoxide dismutase family protein [Acinetobacter sp. ANC 4648]OTG80666.1 superoxide dismutase [Acinetobacter sp. ANC 4648]